jgi:hypothetical protein
MYKFLFIVLLSVSLQAQDIAYDKQMHLYAGAVIGSFTYAFTYDITRNHNKAMILSIAAGTVAGITKELYGMYDIKGNRFDMDDLAATIVGTVLGSITIRIIIN